MTRSAPASTYDDDFFAWTQEQAAALRGLPRDHIGAGIDIEHVAEEIEDLGNRDLREVSSFLARLCEHLIKIDASPGARDVPHWRSEARNFQLSAVDAHSPSMLSLLDVPVLWRRGRTLALISMAAGASSSVPADCPFTLDELLFDGFDLDAALAKLATAPRPASA